MGKVASKNDVDSVKNSTEQLIQILNSKESVKVDEYIQQCIVMGLETYGYQVKSALKKKVIQELQARETHIVIDYAIYKVCNLPIQNKSQKNILDDGLTKNPEHLKKYLDEVGKRLKFNRIKPHEFSDVLKTVALYSLHLEHLSRFVWTKEDKEAASVLILELFIKSSCGNVSEENHENIVDILKKVLDELDNVTSYFAQFSNEHANFGDARKLLDKIKCDVELLYQKTNDWKKLFHRSQGNQLPPSDDKIGNSSTHPGHGKLMETSSSTTSEQRKLLSGNEEKKLHQYKIYLEKLNGELDCCRKEIKEINVPTDYPLKKFQEKISQYYVSTSKIPDSNEQIAEMKNNLVLKVNQILSELNTLIQENESVRQATAFLTHTDHKIMQVIENDNIKEKHNILKECAEKVKLIDIGNTGVEAKKLEILNRVEGLLIVEVINDLEPDKRQLHHYMKYVQQFGYPKNSSEYVTIKEQITQVKNRFNEGKIENVCVSKAMKIFLKMITKILNILEERSSNNTNVVETLKLLEYCKRNAIRVKESPSDFTFCEFNKIREILNTTATTHQRVYALKFEICSEIQNYEQMVYTTQPHLESLKHHKITLNELEKSILKFPHLIIDEAYIQKNIDILELADNVRKVRMRDYRMKESLLHNVQLVGNLLEKTLKENQKSRDCLYKLSDIKRILMDKMRANIDHDKKLDALQHYKLILNALKGYSEATVMKQIYELEEDMSVEKYKIKLMKVNLQLNQLKEKLKTNLNLTETNTFKKTLEDVVIFKMIVENTPEGNPDLDQHKLVILGELDKLLSRLDPYVAKRAYSQKHSENILDLQRHFKDFSLNNFNGSKNSLEFVHAVRNCGQNFEEKVNHYLGTSDSIDYYVINENLMRFVEELDKIECHRDEELLTQTVEAVTYIKSLIDRLDYNVSFN